MGKIEYFVEPVELWEMLTWKYQKLVADFARNISTIWVIEPYNIFPALDLD